MRALIVDDDETFCQLLAETLERQGMEVEWTTESPTGYELAFRRHYDLCILDVRMPLLDGITCLNRIHHRHPDVKVVMLSASEDPMLMELLSMAAGPVAPIGDGPLIKAEGGDDGLDWAAVAEQCGHEGHQIGGFLEPVERGVAGGGEGAAASGASGQSCARG